MSSEGTAIAMTLAELEVAVKADTKDAEAGLKRVSSAIDDMPQQFGKATKGTTDFGSSLSSVTKMAAGFGVAQIGMASASEALSTGFKATIGAAMNYERSLNVLQATSNATADQMRQISARAKELGNDITLPGVSASTATTAMLELSKAGLSVNDTLSASKGVLQLAAAGQIGVADAASITASQLNAFGLAGSEANRVADLLAAAANASQADVRDLGLGMAQASAVFKNAGFTVDDLVTSMAQMANAGIQGSDAATSLKTALLQLQAPTDKSAGVMKEYGINIRDAAGNMLPFRELVAHMTERLSGLSAAQRDAALATMLGTDGIRAGLIVMSAGVETYDKTAAAVGRVGAAGEMAGAQMKGAAGSWAALQSQLETLALSAGEKALPAVTALAEKLNEGFASNTFADWVATTSTAVDTVVIVLDKAKSAYDGLIEKAHQADLALGLMAEKEDKAREAHERSIPVLGELRTIYDAVNNTLDFGHSILSLFGDDWTRFGDGAGYGAQQMDALDQRTQGSIVTLNDAAVAASGVAAETRGVGTAAAEAEAQLNPMAIALGLNEKEFNKLKDPMGEAVKRLRDLGSALTEMQSAVNPQISALDAVSKNLEALNSAVRPADMKVWADRALEMGQQAGLTGPQIDTLRGYIAGIAKDGPASNKVLEDAQKWIGGLEKPLTDAVAAEQSYMKATTDLAESQLGLGRSINDLKTSLQEMVGGFLVALGKVPPAAQTMSSEVLAEWVRIDQQGAIHGTNAGANYALGILAQRQAVSASAKALGDDAVIQFQVAAASARAAGGSIAQGVAAGMLASGSVVRGAAQSIAGEAIAAMRMELQTASPSKVMMEHGRWFASGFAIGIAGGRAEVAQESEGLVEAAIRPMEGALARAMRLSQEFGTSVETVLAPAFSDLAAALTTIHIDPLTAQIADLDAQMKSFDAPLRGLNAQMRDLKAIGADTSGIQAQIDFLQGWKAQLADTTAGLKEQAAAIEANRTALDGFTAAQAKAAQTATLTDVVGTQGLSAAQALVGAIQNPNDPKAGAAAFAAAEKLAADLIAKAGPAGQQWADAVLNASRDAILLRTPEAVDWYLGVVRDATAQLPENAKLSADTWGTALAAALEGQKAPIRLAFDKAFDIGGQANIDALAKLTAGMQSKLAELPEFIRGKLGADFKGALDYAIAGGSREVLDSVLADIDGWMKAIPRGFDEIEPAVRAAAFRLFGAASDGALTYEEAGKRVAEINRMLPANFEEMSTAAQESILATINAYGNLEITAKVAAREIAAANREWAESVKRAAAEAAEATKRAADAWRSEQESISRNQAIDARIAAGRSAADVASANTPDNSMFGARTVSIGGINYGAHARAGVVQGPGPQATPVAGHCPRGYEWNGKECVPLNERGTTTIVNVWLDSEPIAARIEQTTRSAF